MANITPIMHRVLKAIEKAPLNRKLIAEKAFGGNSVNLAKAIKPLVEAKLARLKDVDVDGKVEEFLEISATGKRVAAKPMPTRPTTAAHEALPKAGEFITKMYLGKEVKVKVTADGFEFKGKKYPSLTATAMAVRGNDQAVNGWKFFGLVKPTEKAENPAPKAAKA